MTAYPHLFQPGRIGSVELRNRLVMLPMGTRMVEHGVITERDIAYHEERARGGVGLILTGGTVVHSTSLVRGGILIEPWNPDNAGPLKERVDRIHAQGAKVFGQFLHLGREAPDGQSDAAPLAPSAIPSPRDAYIPHEMTLDEIAMVVAAFGDTTQVHVEAGYDGIEIHAAHGYMIPQFLSTASNKRTDAYGGGSWDDRTRFLMDCLNAVRERVPADMPVGVRLSCDEEIPDGLTVDDTIEIVQRLQATGLVSFLNITVGQRNAYVKDTLWPEGLALDRAARIKATTDLPVMVGGRFRSPQLAEEALAAGRVDFIGIGRALIADPFWVEKARTGEGTIRPCVGIVQDCRLAQGGLTCAVNQAAGREVEWGGTEAPPSANPRTILVVGGGPAGLEAARQAATAGHTVKLVEATQHLGGQWRLAARGPHRGELAEWIDYAESELRRLDVEVTTGVAATADSVEAAGADVVIVATGSQPPLPPLDGEPGCEIVRVVDLLAGDPPPAPEGARALVVDDGGGFWPAISATELLLGQGWQVHLATPARAIGLAIPHESIEGVLSRLRKGGTTFTTLVNLTGVDDRKARLVDVLNGEETLVATDLVVIQSRGVAVDGLVRELRARGTTVHAIGDCNAPRRLTHAILEANTVVRALG